MSPDQITFSFLREQTIGIDAPVETPFGARSLVYADFTASGRMLGFVESYLREVGILYANSHTEDSLTGRVTTARLHRAEQRIKELLNAGENGRLISCGTGSTGAIHKLQEFLGIAVPPATRHFLFSVLGEDAERQLRDRQPVVFVGPYEHHSNEVTWREGLATVLEVDLTPDGGLDLDHLERMLRDDRYAGRPRIGSFSAASNVTGRKTPVHEVARLLHRYDAVACFDFAAAAPYVPIDMNPAGDPAGALDAVFLSPHKFLGGPGSAGVLVFNERLYPVDLPPSVGGGGTVVYVNPDGHAFIRDIEEREKAGTPGILQTLRTALVLEIKDALGIEAIEQREHELLDRALSRWGEDPNIRILGRPDAESRIGIISFNIADPESDTLLHPRFVTTLLDDLFGIQSRAGCSCAGPYAHRILGIGRSESSRLMALSESGFHGVKPGWCRIGFHFTMDDADADFVIEAVAFVARNGHRFLPDYTFNVRSGTWAHTSHTPTVPSFSLEQALNAAAAPPSPVPAGERRKSYARVLAEVEALAASLESRPVAAGVLDGDLEPFRYFCVADGTVTVGSADDAFCGGF
jgi:selenocysteine lyase/cysteine desulfurase